MHGRFSNYCFRTRLCRISRLMAWLCNECFSATKKNYTRNEFACQQIPRWKGHKDWLELTRSVNLKHSSALDVVIWMNAGAPGSHCDANSKSMRQLMGILQPPDLWCCCAEHYFQIERRVNFLMQRFAPSPARQNMLIAATEVGSSCWEVGGEEKKKEKKKKAKGGMPPKEKKMVHKPVRFKWEEMCRRCPSFQIMHGKH